MKKLLTALLATAICGSSSMALDATSAQVTLQKLSSLDFHSLSNPSGSTLSTGKKSRSKGESALAWNFIVVPIKVEGKCKGGFTPDFVPALTVDLSILIDQGRDEKPLLLKKTLNYVDVPVGTVNIGAFITPSSASKLSGSKEKAGKGDLKNKIVAVAIDATFDGENCLNKDEVRSYVFDAAMEKKLSAKWWTSSFEDGGVSLLGINETPYAPFYAAQFPPLDQMYAASSKKSSSSYSSSSSED